MPFETFLTSIYQAEENASVQNITPLVLLRKRASLRKQSKSITLSECLNLSDYTSAVWVLHNITRLSNNGVIHDLQISLLVGLRNIL